MPSTKKRAALSADDLLRRLEEPAAKRTRLSPDVDDDDDASVSSVSKDDEEDGELLAKDVPVRLAGDPIPRSSLVNRNRNPPAQPKEVTFSSLGISTALQSALAAMSIRTPTPVQAACIPPLLAGKF